MPNLPDVPSYNPLLILPQSRTPQEAEYTLSAHTQGGLMQTGIAIAEALDITSSDRVSMAVPYYVGVVYPLGAYTKSPCSYSNNFLVLGILNKAAVLVQPFYKFRAQHVIDSIVKDKASILFIRASDTQSLFGQPLAKVDLSSLRAVVVGMSKIRIF